MYDKKETSYSSNKSRNIMALSEIIPFGLDSYTSLLGQGSLLEDRRGSLLFSICKSRRRRKETRALYRLIDRL